MHWYGIMYLVGLRRWLVARAARAARPGSTWKATDVDDFVFYAMLGVILGGRIGYVLFYGLSFWANDAWYPLKIWEGGMSFHGGLLGVLIAIALFAWRRGRHIGRRVRLHRAAAGHRAVLRAHRQLHQRRAVGQASRRCPGGSASTARCATPRSSTRPRSRAWCSSWCCGGSPRGRGRACAIRAVPDHLRRRAFPDRVRARAG